MYTLPPNPLSYEERQALQKLRNRTDLAILKADKGNSTVVLDRVEYDAKVMEILNDASTYEKLKADPTAKIERELNRKLSSISKVARQRFGSSDSSCPRFYGLPKIHKPGCPLRPIVSYVGSPLYLLSQYLSQVLQPLLTRTHSVVNSSQFAKQVLDVVPKPGEIFVSFDVVSLFPSVPPTFVLDIIRDLLSRSSSLLDSCIFTTCQVLDLLHFILTSTAFRFRGSFYNQITGTPMGSPVSCVVSDIAMERIEMTAFKTLLIQPSFYRRFVDDSFLVLHKDDVSTVFQAFNAVHPSFRFTIEEEIDGKLSFLDVLVVRDANGSISTTIYRKPTHTDRYLAFDSLHPLAHKASVVDTLVHRALTIPSSEALQQNELAHIRSVLQSNGYPPRFVSTRITTVMNRLQSRQPRALVQSERRVYLPYLPGLSEGLSRMLRKYNLAPVLIPPHRISSLLPTVKDSVQALDRSGAVYLVPCVGCEVEYVGETKRKVRTRLKEHAGDIKCFKTSSALFEHFRDTGHKFNFDSASVLHYCDNYHRRLFLEAWEIQCRSLSGKSCCNSYSGKITIPQTYISLHSSCCPQALP
jgi:hypothetical protein